MTQRTTDLNTVPASAARLVFRWNYAATQYSCCIDDVVISLLPSCMPPSSLTAVDVTGHTATLNWTGTSDNSNIDYRTAADTNGLMEEFNSSSFPTGWTRYSTLLTDNVLSGNTMLSSASSGWYSSSYGLGEYNWKVNLYNSTVKYWMVSPGINVQSDYNLSFDAAITAYNSDDAPAASKVPDENSRFVVLISPYGMDTWTILREWNNSGSTYVLNDISATGTHTTIDLSAYAGEIIRVAFYCE